MGVSTPRALQVDCSLAKSAAWVAGGWPLGDGGGGGGGGWGIEDGRPAGGGGGDELRDFGWIVEGVEVDVGEHHDGDGLRCRGEGEKGGQESKELQGITSGCLVESF
jgi:hypothetical protein